MNKTELKELEKKFYVLQDKYNETKSRSAWNEMYLIVLRAVTAAIKQKLVGLPKRNDIDELSLDATNRIMNRYLKPEGYHVQYLLATARFAAVGVLYDKKLQFNDQLLSLDELLEEKA